VPAIFPGTKRHTRLLMWFVSNRTANGRSANCRPGRRGGVTLRALKRLSCRPSVLRVAKALRLQRLLRRVYFLLARPAGDFLEVEVGGVGARFTVGTPEELRLLESCGGAGGERQVLQAVLFALSPADVAYDVGANVGLYTLLMAKAVGDQGQVVAFEPEPKCFARLIENARLNGLSNVFPVPKALGDKTGAARLTRDGTLNSFRVVELQGNAASSPGHTTEVIDGDSYVEQQHLPLPRVVKIDVEGYELRVLRGLRRTLSIPTCVVVSCEVHPGLLPAGCGAEDVISQIRSLGFAHITRYPRWDGTFHVFASKGKA
jgi:FkbM family methyltransferase